MGSVKKIRGEIMGFIRCRNEKCERYDEKYFNNCSMWGTAHLVDGECENSIVKDDNDVAFEKDFMSDKAMNERRFV